MTRKLSLSFRNLLTDYLEGMGWELLASKTNCMFNLFSKGSRIILINFFNSSRNLCKPKEWSNTTVAKFQEARKKYIGQDFETCSCSSGSLQCPSSILSVSPPKIRVLFTESFNFKNIIH
jgi:hypothetical protein